MTLDLAGSIRRNAAEAAKTLSCNSARGKFRARGKVGDEPDPQTGSLPLIQQSAAKSDSPRSQSARTATTRKAADPDAFKIPEIDGIRLPENERIKRYMDAAAAVADQHHSGCATCLRAATPALSVLVWIIVKVAPLYLWLFRKAYWFYTWAPKNVLTMCFGVALCFFGGTYVAAIAAIEAWRLMGWQRSYEDLKTVYAQFRLVYDASNADDLVDADGNGVVDVDEIGPQELAQRKLALAMRTVEEPDKLQTAVGSLWAAYLAVLATLRLEFARVTALALGIAEMIKFPIVRLVSPPLSQALGPELKHWVPTIITSTINILAIAFAWYVQKIISAFYSAIRGGKMFAEAFFAFLQDLGWLEKLPCVAKPFDPNTSYLDELVGYSLAAAGFYTQFRYGFALLFPLNLIFLPLTLVEWILEYQIVMGAPGAA